MESSNKKQKTQQRFVIQCHFHQRYNIFAFITTVGVEVYIILAVRHKDFIDVIRKNMFSSTIRVLQY